MSVSQEYAPTEHSAQWHANEAERWAALAKENFEGGSGPHALEAARTCASLARAHAAVAQAVRKVEAP